MITGTAIYKNDSSGNFSFKSWKTLKKMIIQEKDLKKVNLFIPIKNIDSEIRTIETPKEDFNSQFFIEVGLFESLGEQGGDILTLTYEEFPTQAEIKEDIKENLKETYEDLKDSILSYREETQLKVLKRIERRLSQ